jgi:hypothetical protein
MMKYRRYIFLVIGWVLLTAIQVSGNHEKGDSLGLSYTSISTEKIMVLKSLWSESSNAAALTCIDFGNRVAKAWLGYNRGSGDYSLFQEPKELNRYGFYTSGYSRLGKWRFYGNFNYYNETSNGVRWVDVMEPYNGNPYTVGDSIGGNYWREYYNMEGKSALMITDHLSLGFDVKYKGGVGTKRKDPRPENTITDFEFSPGLIWQSGRLKLGGSFRLESGKEDIEFDAVNDRKYDLFYFRGLGVFSSTTEEDGRYSQTTLLGGGIQGNFSGNFLDNFSSIHFNRQTTDIKRGDTYPLQMVLLDKYSIHASTLFLFNPGSKNIDRLKLQYNESRVYGQEPVVEPKLEEVSWQWSTAAKYTLYWNSGSDYGIGYTHYKIRDQHHFYWGGSIQGKYSKDNTTYYFVPEFNRQKINQFLIDATFEKDFLTGKNQLIVTLNGGYRTSPIHSLRIVEEEKLRETVQIEFLEHDYDYQVTNLWVAGIRMNYGREINLSSFPVQLFIETGYKRFSADPSCKNLFHINAGINF